MVAARSSEPSIPLTPSRLSLRTRFRASPLADWDAAWDALQAGLFETGRVFFAESDTDDARIPSQPLRLGFAVFGVSGGLELGGAGRPTDAYTATAITGLIAEVLDLNIDLRGAMYPGFHPGQAGVRDR